MMTFVVFMFVSLHFSGRYGEWRRTYCSAVPDTRHSEVYPGRPSPSYYRFRPLSASFLFDLSDTVSFSLPIDDRTVYDRDRRVPVPPHFRARPRKVECRVSRVLVDDHLECDRGPIVHIVDGLRQSPTTVISRCVIFQIDVISMVCGISAAHAF